jgi:hypothetical protein
VTLLAGAVSQAGHQPSGDAFGPGGLFSLASPGQNQELLNAAGFSKARVDEVAEVMSFDDFDDFWDMQSQVAGSLALLISSLPAGETDAIRAALKPALAPFQEGVRLELPSLAVVASASSESRG